MVSICAGVTFVILLAAFEASAYPNKQTKTNQNHTVQPAPDGCAIFSASDVATVTASCTTINVAGFNVAASDQPLIFNLKTGSSVTFTGEIHFDYHAFSGYLIEIIGSNIKVVGTSTHLFHGHGEEYWNSFEDAKSDKPAFMYLKGTSGSLFTGLNIKNCPMRCVVIDGSNITVSGLLIDNCARQPDNASAENKHHDIKVFDVILTQSVTLTNNVIYNQNDCKAKSKIPLIRNTPNIPAIALTSLGNDLPWYQNNIPFFESSDSLIDEVYYYRWLVVRAHQRDLGERGFISTEFLDDVSWQLAPYASLNDATGFHLGEVRWLRDRRYASDYLNHMYQGGNDRHFSEYIADAAYSRYLVDGDQTEAISNLDAMRTVFNAWDDHFDETKGLYWVEPLSDATEYTIASIDASGGEDGFSGGEAFRPSINSYMFANARAIAKLAEIAGQLKSAKDFEAKAEAIKAHVLADLWNTTLVHFIDRFRVNNSYVKYWDPIRGRELVGYVPWAFNLPDNDASYAGAWAHILSSTELAGTAGLRTVEPSYEYYLRQYRYDGEHPECQWNGPTWPFQTTQVLLGLANFLNNYTDTQIVSRSDYMRLLRQYANLHYRGNILDLEEDYDPETGIAIVGLDRSHHYFHSGFIDLILSGLVGIRPRDDDILEVNPLLPDSSDAQALQWFKLWNVPYHGHLITVTWDVDGTHYNQGVGLSVDVDGVEMTRTASLQRITIPITRMSPPEIIRPINQAVLLVQTETAYPKCNASTNSETAFQAIDGRVRFFTETAHGWSSTAYPEEQWYQVDFGKSVNLSRAEISFFSDGQQFLVPASCRLQTLTSESWIDVSANIDVLVANGITNAIWATIEATQIRLVIQQAAGFSTRLVEFKLF